MCTENVRIYLDCEVCGLRQRNKNQITTCVDWEKMYTKIIWYVEIELPQIEPQISKSLFGEMTTLGYSLTTLQQI